VIILAIVTVFPGLWAMSAQLAVLVTSKILALSPTLLAFNSEALRIRIPQNALNNAGLIARAVTEIMQIVVSIFAATGSPGSSSGFIIILSLLVFILNVVSIVIEMMHGRDV
jgi:hypothetical protein